MKISTLDNFLLAGFCLLITACGTDISESLDKDANPGSADFSTFVAIGDSLTAGYKDGALYRDGQLTSYPAILAQQFAKAGGGAFRQPLMPVSATGSLTIGAAPIPGVNDRLIVVGTGNPDQPVTPTTISPTVSTEIVPALTGPFNNLGVPAAKSFHVDFNGYGNPANLGVSANPFFVRFVSDGATTANSSMLDDAILQAPTFYVVWIGNNDILLYAVDGGDPTVSGQSVTATGTFNGAFNAMINDLAVAVPTAKGVLVNIPDATTIPYFNTVPYNAIPLTASQASTANMGFAPYNLSLQALAGSSPCGTLLTPEEMARRQITFVEGQNPVVILDENLADVTCVSAALVNMRQATAKDFPLLTTASKLGTDAGGGLLWGISAPLLDSDVLIEDEVDEIEAARSVYNATIKAAADADPNLVLFDAAAKLNELNTTGILYGSGGVSSAFIQGGAFSADGVHPTARGYAVIANEIMKVIENGFGAELPPVNPSDYSTVFFK